MLSLDDPAAESSASASWFNSLAPDSNVVNLGTLSAVNGSGDDYVAYCWSEVAGYSSFGSYKGNGSSSDGTFVYLGFKPAFFMIKAINTGQYWFLGDTARDPYNIGDFNGLWANTNGAEFHYGIDVVSNGIKHYNTSANLNDNSTTFLYAAWAESPFKYANAR
jgi:hypothetical protein